MGLQAGQLCVNHPDGLHLGLGAPGLHDFLVCTSLRQTDVSGYLIVGGVDGSQCRFHVRRRIDPRNERGIEHHAVSG